MKLSEAIRLGAMMKPQAFYKDGVSVTGKSCALDAAGDAIGTSSVSTVLKEWPILNAKVACPECGKKQEMGCVIGFCLNDDHRWTRERIADWVSEIEQQQEKANAAETVGPEAAISR